MPRSATTRLGRAARAARPARRCGARTRRLDRRPSSDRRCGAHRPTSSRSSLIVTVPVSLTNANRGRSRRRAARRVGLAPGPDPSPTPSRSCRPLPAPRPVVDHESDRDDVRPSVSCGIAALPEEHSHALCQKAGRSRPRASSGGRRRMAQCQSARLDRAIDLPAWRPATADKARLHRDAAVSTSPPPRKLAEPTPRGSYK